ncbi:LLM class F420-dependent oxidoreductase [Cellulomonas marina]|uniref:Probable F420-dependent oxidoreductase, Rv3520c family n=1 Tax=Cellulomonas marina TaxID=988821 RepID=A0A1I0VAI0_9CELL|nr:LLM class F420-dependent oxidoreductase [Cellulomonas marina]GIG29199.1 LLM class F420-dependent oxidoreductase [Cellulomonas marina]SFA73040.1 probable F420-dependent oxidoreductase, Rv3520c family [Cellulomonas marina]
MDDRDAAPALGYHTGYWSAGPPAGVAEAVAGADALGLDSVWTAEAYGSDAFTPLAWWGAGTRRVRLGTAVAQVDARTPTATAMAAMTLDHLSGGRAVLGLGASGVQVVEGWYGRPYARPLARTREFVAVVRQVLRREGPVRADGEFYRLPLPEPEGSGQGRALRPTLHPLRADLPVLLAAQGPRNVALAAEIADGWLPLFVTPSADERVREQLADGFARRDPRLRPPEAFEVVATVPVALGPDVESAADRVRPFVALYAGGMGAPGANHHRAALDRLGFAEVLDEVEARFRAGDRERAAAAVPTELVREVALVGTPADLTEQARRWSGSVATTLALQTDPADLPAVVGALRAAGLGGGADGAARPAAGQM